MKNLYIFLSFSLFLLSSFLFSTASCGGIAIQSAFLYPFNGNTPSCPRTKSEFYDFTNDCKPILTLEVQFDNPVEVGDLLTLLGVSGDANNFFLMHIAPVNEPFIRNSPNQNYFDPNQASQKFFGRLTGDIKENLNGLTYMLSKTLLPGIFYRVVYELSGGTPAQTALFCLGLQTLTKNMQQIDSNECIYPFKELLAPFSSNLATNEIIAMEPKIAPDTAVAWNPAFDTSTTNTVIFVLKFTTIGWQEGNVVEFKFPDAFTVKEKNGDQQQIKLFITKDLTANSNVPDWSYFLPANVIYQKTPDGFHRFVLPHFTHAHQDLETTSSTLFDPAATNGAFRFQFLLQNLGPDYVNFEEAVYRVILPDTNKIIKAGVIKWAAGAPSGTGIMNYASDSVGTSGTLELFWGLTPGPAKGLTGNVDNLCKVNIMITKSNTQIFWNSLKFTFDVTTLIRSFTDRENLVLLVKDKTVVATRKSAVLLNSVKHNLPMIGIPNIIIPEDPGSYLKIFKIGHMPKKHLFCCFQGLFILQ